MNKKAQIKISAKTRKKTAGSTVKKTVKKTGKKIRKVQGKKFLSRFIKTAAFGILLLLILTLFSLYLFRQPAEGGLSIIPLSENESTASKEARPLFMDMDDKNTYERFRLSKQIDATPIQKKFMGCFYNNTIDRDFNAGRYTLVYYDMYGTSAMNFTFENLAAAENTAKGYGVCIYSLNHEFVRKR